MDKIAKDIYTKLKKLIPNLECELNYNNIFELIVAVVLSAQCTDKRVNMVTPALFAKYPDCYSMSRANEEELQEIIRPCGTYKIKAKNLISMSKDIVERYNGQVPRTIEELTSLAGVGRKTASVVLAEGYKIPALPVDTHILRVTNRLGLVHTNDPNAVEECLKSMYEEKYWIELHYLLLLFGRYHCKAVGYNCRDCVVKDICKYDKKVEK